MRTECLHRTLSPQAYATLKDQLRHRAEAQRRCAIQASIQAIFQLAWTAFRTTRPAQRQNRPALDCGCPAASSQSLQP